MAEVLNKFCFQITSIPLALARDCGPIASLAPTLILPASRDYKNLLRLGDLMGERALYTVVERRPH